MSKEASQEGKLPGIPDPGLAEEPFRDSESYHRMILETSIDGFWLADVEGRILEVNKAYCRMSGYSADELLGMHISNLDAEESANDVLSHNQKIMAQGKDRFRAQHRRKDGSLFDVEMSVEYNPIKGGRLVAFIEDISESMQRENENEQIAKLTVMVNTQGNLHQLMSSLTGSLQLWSKCEAVGIRLKSGDDYPYFETRGFPPKFVELENRLCAYGSDGKIQRDGKGDPFYECMCGNVLSGRFDASKPFFTANGSFWANNTTRLLATTSDADRQTPTRNRCNGEGYESVALIPLRDNEQVFGLLQFNDHRADRFTPGMIGHMERIADNLAMALSRRQAQEALRKSEENYRMLYESSPIGIELYDTDGHLIHANPACLAIFGLTSEEPVLGFNLFADPNLSDEHKAAIRRNEIIKYIDLFDFDKVRELSLYPTIRSGQIMTEVMIKPLANGKGYQCLIQDITDRVKAEEALQESEQTHRALIENIPDVVMRFDRKGRHLFVSDNVCQVVDIQASQFIGKTHHDLGFPQEQCIFWESAVRSVFDSGIAFETEFSFDGKNGPSTHNWRLIPEHDAQGRVQSVLSLSRDITAQRRAERDYQTLFHEMLEGFVLHEIVCNERGEPIDYRYLAMNPAFERMMGFKASEVVGKSILELKPNTQSHWIETYGKVALAGMPISFEYYSKAFDKYYSVTAYQPAPGQFACICNDITERKKAEMAIQASEERFRRIFQHSASGMVLTSLDYHFFQINNAFCRMLGYSESELLGKSFQELTYPEDRPASGELVRQVQSGEVEAFQFEKRYLHKNGTLVWGLVCVTLIRDAQNKPLHFAAQIQDITDRKETERALQENSELFSLFMHHSPIYTYIKEVSPDQSYVIQASENFEQMVGIPGHEMIGKTMSELFPPEFAEKITAEDWAVVSKGSILQLDEELNGRSYTTIKFPIAQGNKTLLAGYTIDITERKRAEEAQRESRQILEGIINSIPVRVFWKDKDLVYLGCNAAFARDAGFPDPKEIIGKDDYQMGWQNQAELYCGDDRRVIESGCPALNIEEPQTTPEGKTITLLTNKVPLRNAMGEICGMIGTYLDITERKNMEEALQESEERFRKLFEESPIGIAFFGKQREILLTNQRYRDFLGYSEAEIIQRGPVGILHTDDWGAAMEQSIKLRSGEISLFHMEQRYIRKDGMTVYADTHITALRDKDGQLIQTITWVQDITERKQAEQEKAKLENQLQQAQKMESVGRLAGGVAHDFNNMLGVILGHTEMALDWAKPDQPLYENLQEVRRAAARSADLTQQLLAFARKQTVAPKVLDLNEKVEGMLKMLQRLIGENIDLAWQPKSELWPVRIDPTQVDQILANLSVNARDAITDVGKITIETGNAAFDEDYCSHHAGFTTGDYVMLGFSDNGCGMDKDTMSHLFEPFFTTKGIGKGTGLGLATIYGVVKQNNGFINAYSEPGNGTTFRIYLPRHVGKIAQPQTEQSAGLTRQGVETILLVEDEKAILKMTEMMLKMQGYSVLAASSPGEAIRIAQERAGEIHLLMTDVVMPEMNGRDLARNLLSLYPDLKRLFMSGYTADVIAHHGVLDEGVCFIQKPFSIKELATKVREALGKNQE